MDDKTIMETMLYAVKGTCDLYLHGAIESVGSVHGAFSDALKQSLQIQTDIYNKMSEKGWYQTKQVSSQQVQQTAQKFAGQ